MVMSDETANFFLNLGEQWGSLRKDSLMEVDFC